MNKCTAQEFITMLSNQGHLQVNSDLIDFIIAQKQEKEMPLYLKVLIGIGALIASICFIVFLAEANIINFNDEFSLTAWGFMFVVAAIALQRFAGSSGTSIHSFLVQSSFASMAVGKCLFVIGFQGLMNSDWGISVALLVITAVTYHVYRMSLDRFLSTSALLLSILANIIIDTAVSSSRELLYNSFFLLQLLVITFLSSSSKIKHAYTPLAYAFIASICASVLFISSQSEFSDWSEQANIRPFFANGVLALSLITLMSWAAGGIHKLKQESLICASLGIIVLGFVSIPGVMVSIGLLILGYAKHEKSLIAMGIMFMPLFLFHYYYSMDISLMQKSMILVGSGILLLLGGFYINYKGWSKETIQ